MQNNLTNFKHLFGTVALIFGLAISGNAQPWTQKGGDLSGAAAFDEFGLSVSMSSDGNTIAIGGRGNDGNGTDAGHVQIFEWNGTSWTQKGGDIQGEAAGDGFGYDVSISADGNTFIAGAPDNVGIAAAGHARVFQWNGAAWTQKGADIDGEAGGDDSGYSVSISANGDIVAIGALHNDGGGSDNGHSRIFSWDGNNWNQLGSDIEGVNPSDLCGANVSLSSNGLTIAVSSYGNDDAFTDAGHVRIFDWTGAAWAQRGLSLEGEALSDLFGNSITINADGNTVAIGSQFNDGGGSNAGHVKIYTWSGTEWLQQGQTIIGENAGDLSGRSVSLDAIGNTVAIGSVSNDDGVPNAGQVRVYNWDGNAWVLFGSDIHGNTAGEQSGRDVSLSADGLTIGIGAFKNGEIGTSAGEVKVYTHDVATTVFGDEPLSSLKLYPTITGGNFIVELGKLSDEILLIIRNQLGQVLTRKTYHDTNRINQNIAGVSGMYFVEIRGLDQSVILKVIKQ